MQLTTVALGAVVLLVVILLVVLVWVFLRRRAAAAAPIDVDEERVAARLERVRRTGGPLDPWADADVAAERSRGAAVAYARDETAFMEPELQDEEGVEAASLDDVPLESGVGAEQEPRPDEPPDELPSAAPHRPEAALPDPVRFDPRAGDVAAAAEHEVPVEPTGDGVRDEPPEVLHEPPALDAPPVPAKLVQDARADALPSTRLVEVERPYYQAPDEPLPPEPAVRRSLDADVVLSKPVLLPEDERSPGSEQAPRIEHGPAPVADPAPVAQPAAVADPPPVAERTAAADEEPAVAASVAAPPLAVAPRPRSRVPAGVGRPGGDAWPEDATPVDPELARRVWRRDAAVAAVIVLLAAVLAAGGVASGTVRATPVASPRPAPTATDGR